MLIVRPAGPANIDALLELALLSGTGFTSLPEDRRTLAERFAIWERSFSGEAAAEDAWFVLMLE